MIGTCVTRFQAWVWWFKTPTKKQCGFKMNERGVQKHAPWEMIGRLHSIASPLLVTPNNKPHWSHIINPTSVAWCNLTNIRQDATMPVKYDLSLVLFCSWFSAPVITCFPFSQFQKWFLKPGKNPKYSLPAEVCYSLWQEGHKMKD